jgi:hypothetical protein
MHMSMAIDVTEKQGHFKAYAEAHGLYVEQRNLVRQAKATLTEQDEATSKGERTSKKSSKNAKQAAAMADAPDPELCAIYQQDLKKAKEAAEAAKDKEKFAANEMFWFYGNLLSADAKYAWNKIVKEQTVSDPYMNLQGISTNKPRGPSPKSFDDCVMFTFSPCFPAMRLSKKSTIF